MKLSEALRDLAPKRLKEKTTMRNPSTTFVEVRIESYHDGRVAACSTYLKKAHRGIAGHQGMVTHTYGYCKRRALPIAALDHIKQGICQTSFAGRSWYLKPLVSISCLPETPQPWSWPASPSRQRDVRHSSPYGESCRHPQFPHQSRSSGSRSLHPQG